MGTCRRTGEESSVGERAEQRAIDTPQATKGGTGIRAGESTLKRGMRADGRASSVNATTWGGPKGRKGRGPEVKAMQRKLKQSGKWENSRMDPTRRG